MRIHEKSAVEQYPKQVGLKCVKCEKVSKSKAGTMSHLRSHAKKEDEEDNPRCRTRERVDK